MPKKLETTGALFSPLDYPAKLDLMAGVVAFIAAIGGIGKTTTTNMTAASLQAAALQVFLCELDQQKPLAVRHANVHSEKPARVGPEADQENLFLVEAQIDSILQFRAEHPEGVALFDIGANLDGCGLAAISGAGLDIRLAKASSKLLVCVLLSADPATWEPTKALLARWRGALDSASFVFVVVDKKDVFSRGLAPGRAQELQTVLGAEIAEHGVLRMPDISGRTEVVLRASDHPWHQVAGMDPVEIARLTGHPRAGLSAGENIRNDIEALITDWRTQLQRLSFRC